MESQVVPIGSITAFAGSVENIPSNWMLCDGRELPIQEYENLYRAIGSSWGGDNISKFRIPNLSGVFLRGVDFSKSNDPDRDSRINLFPNGNAGNDVGTYQPDQVMHHTHNTAHFHKLAMVRVRSGYETPVAWVANDNPPIPWNGADQRTPTTQESMCSNDETTKNQNNPVNVSVFWIIKFN